MRRLLLFLAVLTALCKANVLLVGNITQGCTPHCVTHCQAPRPPPPTCYVIASPVQCGIVCSNPAHITRCNVPVCVVDTATDQCPADSCPLCDVQCSQLQCDEDVHDCEIDCPPPQCTWECVMADPATIPPAVCDIRCEQPSCGATVAFVNRTLQASAAAAAFTAHTLLLLLLGVISFL